MYQESEAFQANDVETSLQQAMAIQSAVFLAR